MKGTIVSSIKNKLATVMFENKDTGMIKVIWHHNNKYEWIDVSSVSQI